MNAAAEQSPQLKSKEVAGTDELNAGANNELLVAPCGLYCGACPMYLASRKGNEQKREELSKQFASGKMNMKPEDFLCDGCISGGRVAVFCRRCEMRSCAAEKSDVTRCSDCSDFPCSLITNFNNDGMLHHAEVLENIRNIQKMGIKDWTRHEKDRWMCPECRYPISWYDAKCSNCGAKRSERLFTLTRG